MSFIMLSGEDAESNVDKLLDVVVYSPSDGVPETITKVDPILGEITLYKDIRNYVKPEVVKEVENLASSGFNSSNVVDDYVIKASEWIYEEYTVK